jgi:hypothetical protein
MTPEHLEAILVRHNIIHESAIEDTDGYDNYATFDRIRKALPDIIKAVDDRSNELHRRLQLAEGACSKLADNWLSVEKPRGGSFGRALLTCAYQKSRDEIARLQSDVVFLADRGSRTGSCRVFDMSERDTGMSSNSIVGIAYGLVSLDKQFLPSDMEDLMSCRRMWSKLPDHRRTDDAKEAMKRAEQAVKRQPWEKEQ